MKDEIISFETAKLAKEKGLVEGIDCEYLYSKIKGRVLLPSIKNLEGYFDGKLTNERESHLFFAPTQSLLQRWLREVHNINLFVFKTKYINSLKDCWCCENDYMGISDISTEGTDTYEEALELGLKEALKLIE